MVGGTGRIGTEFGEDPPVLQVGESVFDRCASRGEDLIGVLLAGSELVGAAGHEAGDDHRVEHVVVQSAESEVREGTEAGGSQVGHDVVVAGGGDVVSAAGADGGLGHVVAPAMSAKRRSCRSTAKTITAILPGGRIRHLDRITFRWHRSSPARWLTVRVDSGKQHW